MIRVVLMLLAALSAAPTLAEPARIVGSARVIDGGTIDVGVVRIRLHGIDAPAF